MVRGHPGPAEGAPRAPPPDPRFVPRRGCGDRRIELHFRRILGAVVYHVGDLSLSHEAYMRAVLGLDGSNEFPHFTGDPLDGFRHLAHDLSTYCGAFLKGPPAHFREIVRRAGEQAQLRLYRSELEH